MEDCLFCKIVAGDIPADIVYQDADVTAFRDINPAAPTHILVIPNKHIAAINEASAEDQALLGKLLLVANQIAEQEGLAEDGFRYVINTGGHGGQTVFHIHLHILGGRQMDWPPG
ncbi:MAG: histidine triad nucleotide-binding protein [Pseudomonadales bacterium]|nr:histidine triad nucleotide-binding protein [Pseudomonadales bacterium]